MQNNLYSKLRSKLINKDAKIAIIGLGYVGLPLAIYFSKMGYKLIGIDQDKSKINYLKKGISYISQYTNKKIKEINFFNLSINFESVSESDVIILCLPTPLNKNKQPNLSYIKNAARSLEKFMKKGQVFSLESTTYPGTTEDIFLPIFKKRGLIVGKDVFLVYSPEREDPGNKRFNISVTNKIVSGYSKHCLNLAKLIYSNKYSKLTSVSNLKVAEMTKLLENIYRSINIGLVNEMKIICDSMSIDIDEVIDAAKTKPFGFQAFYPGPGVGGHCIPIDPYYLQWQAKKYGINSRFIKLAGEINDLMPKYTVNSLKKSLKRRKIDLKETKILILGLSYKKNINDMRESPSLKIIKILSKLGCEIFFNDPFFENLPNNRIFNIDLKKLKLNKKNLNFVDCVVLLTDHEDFDYKFILKHSRLIFDTRNIFPKSNKIIS